MSCLLKIRSAREQMSASEKKLADFILKNAALIRDYSSQQLASSVGVSQSSVVKFSQKIGYKGFTDLKLAIHETVVRQETGSGKLAHGARDGALGGIRQRVYQSKCEVLASTGDINDDERLIAAVRAIETANRMQVIASGTASLIARDLVNKLTVLGYSVSAEADMHIQLAGVATLGKGDLLLVICATGQTRSLIHMAQQAKKAGATVISATSYQSNPLTALADIKLYSVSHNGSPDLPQILEPVSQQHVVDLLFYHLIERNSHGRELLIRGQKALKDLLTLDN